MNLLQQDFGQILQYIDQRPHNRSSRTEIALDAVKGVWKTILNGCATETL